MAAERTTVTQTGGMAWAGSALQRLLRDRALPSSLLHSVPTELGLGQCWGQHPSTPELQLRPPSLSRESPQALHCPAWAALLQAPTSKDQETPGETPNAELQTTKPDGSA